MAPINFRMKKNPGTLQHPTISDQRLEQGNFNTIRTLHFTIRIQLLSFSL